MELLLSSSLFFSLRSFVSRRHVLVLHKAQAWRQVPLCDCCSAPSLLLLALAASRAAFFAIKYLLSLSSFFFSLFFFLLFSSSSFNTLCHLVTTSKKRNIQHETNHTKHMIKTTCSHTKRIFSFDVFEIRVCSSSNVMYRKSAGWIATF